MNKALEQKRIGPMEESHTKEQSPHAVLREVLWARRSSQQQGLELVLELVFRVCGRKKKRMGAGISGGGPPWALEAGGAPKGVGRALHPRDQVAAPPAVIFALKILKYSRKIIFHFQGIWRTFIFGVFLYCTDKSKNRQKNTIFTLFQLNNRK